MLRIAYYSNQRQEYALEEDFMSLYEVLRFAEILTHIAEILWADEEDLPADEYLAFCRAYKHFIDKHRRKGDFAFRGLCEHLGVLADQLGEAFSLKTGRPAPRPTVEEFHPHVRALLGRLILSQKPVGPETAAEAVPCLVWVGLNLQNHLDHAQEIQAASAEHFDWALKATRLLLKRCETAEKINCSIVFID